MTPEVAKRVGAAVQSLDVLQVSDLLNLVTHGQPNITVRLWRTELRMGTMVWEYESRDRTTLWLNRLFAERPLHARRVGWLIPLIQAYHRHPDAVAGRVAVHLPDAAHGAGLGFSSADPRVVLIPDPVFISRNAYADSAATYRAQGLPWAEKKPICFWRGSASGSPIGPARRARDWRQRPRIRMVDMVKDHPLFDVGLSRVAPTQVVDETMVEQVKAMGLIKGYVPSDQFVNYKYQIDIDGNSNAWAGYFLKLLTGCPVLKVESPAGFRQWYYDRLIPMQHYVPVKSDCSDLISQTEWLVANDESARQIGEMGRAVAESMTVDGELNAVVPAVVQAMASASVTAD